MKYLIALLVLCSTFNTFSQKVYTHWDAWYQFENDSTLWYRFDNNYVGIQDLSETPHDIRIVLQDDEGPWKSYSDWEEIEDGIINIYNDISLPKDSTSAGGSSYKEEWDPYFSRYRWVPDTTKLRISYTVKNGKLDGAATEYCRWCDYGDDSCVNRINQQYIYSEGTLQQIKKYSCREGNPLIKEIPLKYGRGVEFYNTVKGRPQFKLYNYEKEIYDSRRGRYRDGGDRFNHRGNELLDVRSSREGSFGVSKSVDGIRAGKFRLRFNENGTFIDEFRYGSTYIYDYKLKKYKIKERNQYHDNGKLKTKVKYGKRNKVIKKCFDEDGNVVKCN